MPNNVIAIRLQDIKKGGIIQGGIVTGWLDVAMATACLVDGEDGLAVASLEIKETFLLAAHPGSYRAYGTVMRRGRSIGFMEAELRDSNDVLIATASSTAALRDRSALRRSRRDLATAQSKSIGDTRNRREGHAGAGGCLA